MRTIKSKEARANWSALIRSVEKGETVVIELYDRTVAKLVPCKTSYVVECYDSVTESVTRGVQEFETQRKAQERADLENSKHGSEGPLGPHYYVVRVDEDGNEVPWVQTEPTTGDSALDDAVMGGHDRPE